jgi:hypothetical protein
MKLHSVFLRKGCILPEGLEPVQEPMGDGWTVVAGIPALVFDGMVRQARWHFMWMQGSCSRRGFGLTREKAAHRALARVLNGITRRFNAAELDSIENRNFLGIHIANVTLQPRQIQQHSSLESGDDMRQQARATP